MSDAWLVAPVAIPLVAAMLAVLFEAWPRAVRAVAVVATLAQGAVAVALLRTAATGTVLVHRAGDWPVPHGIVLVGDRLAALLLALALALALPVLAHALRGEDGRGRWFHAFLQLLLAGLAGAFLTGDLFTLFVCFEVLLIASYALLVHGTTAPRLRWGLHYVLLNLVGSTLFLVAAGLLYGLVGTLNLAELARRVATLPAADVGAVHAAALLLLVVFALKAALVPLHLWLPGSYAAATPAVAALFAIMTKVGVYGVLRVFGVAFGPGAGALAGIAERWLFPAALLTTAAGALGALGRRDLPRIAGALLVLSVGTLVAALAPLGEAGVAAGLYYLAHSTLAGGALFLLAAAVEAHAPPARRHAVGGALFALGAVAIAGLPPLSGFVGKALILASAPRDGRGTWLWATLLVTSGVAILALARAGIAQVWGRAADDDASANAAVRVPLVPAGALLAMLVALTVGAGPAVAFTTATATQLLAPPDADGGYVRTVLGTPGGRR